MHILAAEVAPKQGVSEDLVSEGKLRLLPFLKPHLLSYATTSQSTVSPECLLGMID